MDHGPIDLSAYPRRDVRRWKLAHHAHGVYLAVATALVVHDLLIELPSLVLLALGWGAYLALCADHRHHSELCGLCAAMAPLDGSAAAAHHDLLLRSMHKTRIWIPLAFALLAGNLLPLVLDVPVIPELSRYLGLVMWAWLTRAQQVHSLLGPWCRYCRKRRGEDDGDTHDRVPDPTPPGAQSRL